MKEIKVAKLDKDDVRGYKELEQQEKEIRNAGAMLNSAVIAYWEGLRLKHSLPFGKAHYIRGGVIYRQE